MADALVISKDTVYITVAHSRQICNTINTKLECSFPANFWHPGNILDFIQFLHLPALVHAFG